MQTEAHRPKLLEDRLRILQLSAAVAAAAMGVCLLYEEHLPTSTGTAVNYDLSWIAHGNPYVMQSKEAHCLCAQPLNDRKMHDASFLKTHN